MKSRSRIAAIGASVALAAAAAGISMMPAGAESISINAPITGALQLTTSSGASTLDVSSGSSFSGAYDTTSGALTGSIALGNSSFTTTTSFGEAIVAISFTNGGPITNGTVSGTSVAFTDVETVNLVSATVNGTAIPLGECRVGPVTLNYSGTVNPATGDVSVTSGSPVPVPALAGDCGGLASMIAPMLEGATVVASAQLNIGAISTPTTQPGETTTTVEGATTTTQPGGTTTLPEATTTLPGVTTTTEPTGPISTIGSENITSNGCVVTVPVNFGASGTYTVEITTDSGKVLGTTTVTRNEAGSAGVDVNIDPNHGTHHGDNLNITLTDANGAILDEAVGQVADPEACTPSTTTRPATTTRPLVTPSARPASAVTAQPAYTG